MTIIKRVEWTSTEHTYPGKEVRRLAAAQTGGYPIQRELWERMEILAVC